MSITDALMTSTGEMKNVVKVRCLACHARNYFKYNTSRSISVSVLCWLGIIGFGDS